MEYFNIDDLKNAIVQNKSYEDMIENIKVEVDDFCKNFNDSPSKISRWGHHYFCYEDGGLLIYDRSNPSKHKCEICGRVYENELLNGVWVYMYRNEAIINVWKSALLYRLTEEEKYLNYIKKIIGFYADNYLKFELHNKEGESFKSLEDMKWGCGRIMPQNLNEAIFIVRMVNALELVKDHIGKDFLEKVDRKLFQEVFKLLKPQIDEIHNIRCWMNSAVGIMGLFSGNDEMVDFAFNGPYNIRRQLREGVTKDGFWYEGSIHYNFFTLEGISNLLLFSEIYDYDFGDEKEIVRNMFKSAYIYAFDNHQLPNPNDGWPNVNLKTYSYIYSIGAKIFGLNSDVGNLLKNILKKDYTRATVPLSRPYYFNNEISLERLILVPQINLEETVPVKTKSTNFQTSYCAIIKSNNINIFCKYGHNGPSHAHPDKMNIEVIVGDYSLSRDLSNSGYGNRFCNEWHRISASHNTVVVNGENHKSFLGGKCISFKDNLLDVEAKDVYEGVDFRRRVEITDNGFIDQFDVTSNHSHIYDYFFHVEADLLSKYDSEKGKLKFNNNGYQHIYEVEKIITDKPYIDLKWRLGEYILTSRVFLDNKELFIGKTPDNPVTKKRTTLIIRDISENATFKIIWEIKKEG